MSQFFAAAATAAIHTGMPLVGRRHRTHKPGAQVKTAQHEQRCSCCQRTPGERLMTAARIEATGTRAQQCPRCHVGVIDPDPATQSRLDAHFLAPLKRAGGAPYLLTYEGGGGYWQGGRTRVRRPVTVRAHSCA